MATFNFTVAEGSELKQLITFDDFGFKEDVVIDLDITSVVFSGDAIKDVDYTFEYELTDAGILVTFTSLTDDLKEDDEVATISIEGFIDWAAPGPNGEFLTNIKDELIFGTLTRENISESADFTITDINLQCEDEEIESLRSDIQEIKDLIDKNDKLIVLDETELSVLNKAVLDYQITIVKLGLFDIGTSSLQLANAGLRFIDKWGVSSAGALIGTIFNAQTGIEKLNAGTVLTQTFGSINGILAQDGVSAIGVGATNLGVISNIYGGLKDLVEIGKRNIETKDIISNLSEQLKQVQDRVAELPSLITELTAESFSKGLDLFFLEAELASCLAQNDASSIESLELDTVDLAAIAGEAFVFEAVIENELQSEVNIDFSFFAAEVDQLI